MTQANNIFDACKYGAIDYISEYLNEQPNDIDITNEYNESLLHIAAQHGHVHIVLLLLQHHVNINATDGESNWTALHRAAYYSQLHCYYVLIQYGINVDVIDNSGLKAYQLLQQSLQHHAMSWYITHGKHRVLQQNYQQFTNRNAPNNHNNPNCHNCLYVCGVNTSNQLGNVRVERFQSKAKVLHSIEQIDILHMDCNKYETAIVSTDGKLYRWGRTVNEPQQAVLDNNITVKSLSMSDDLICIATDDHDQNTPVYITGNNINRFTTDASNNKSNFVLLPSTMHLQIAHVSCSNTRVILQTESGQLYLIGQSLMDDTFNNKPVLLQLPDNVIVQQSIIDDNVLVVLTSEGDVLQFRDRRFMRVHFKLTNTIREQTTNWRSNISELHQLTNDDISMRVNGRLITIRKIAVCAAANRALAVGYDGKAYHWKLKSTDNKILNTSSISPTIKAMSNIKVSQYTQSPPTNAINTTHKQRNTRIEARLIDSTSNEFFVDVAVRRGQSCLLTNTGHVYTFGLDCLGTGNNTNTGIALNTPTKINHLSQVTGVCLGADHMLLTVSTHHQPKPIKSKTMTDHVQRQIDTLQLLCEKN